MTKNGQLLPLEPLAKELKEDPTIAQGLLLVVSGDRTYDLVQLGMWCPDTSTYPVSRVEKPADPTVPRDVIHLGIPDVCAASSLATDFGNHYVPADHIQTHLPYPNMAKTISTRYDMDSHEAVYIFVNLVTNSHINRCVVSSRDGNSSSHSSSDFRSRRRHSHFSAAAQACMDIPPARLADRTGTDLIQLMHLSLSAVEESMGKDPAHASVFMGCGTTLYDSLLDCQFGKVENYASVSSDELNKRSKTPIPNSLKGSTQVLLAWNNIVLAIFRAFELTPGSPLAVALWRVSPDMSRFINDRQTTQPELVNNDFCSIYLNLLLKKFAQVFGDYHSTSGDIAHMISELRVGENTLLFQLTKTQLTQMNQEKLDILYASHTGGTTSGHSATKSKSSVTPNKTKSSPAPKAKSDKPCMLQHTTTGCSRGEKCIFRHTTDSLTATQKDEITKLINQSNSRNPNKTPLVAAFGSP
jgi:hypothetical protein